MTLYFFQRKPGESSPGGVTVSKTEELPDGDFRVTEFYWGKTSLWFVDDHHFSASERQEAYKSLAKSHELMQLAST